MQHSLISNYDIDMTQASSTAASNSKLQLNHHTHNVSPTSTFYSPPSGPGPVEFRLVSREVDSPYSPGLSSRGSPNIFQQYDLPDTSHGSNGHTVPNINTSMQELQYSTTIHAHSDVNNQISGCIVCGQSYDQVPEEVAADYLLRTTQPGETVEDRQRKRQAFLAGTQCAAVTFIPRGVSQAAN